MGNHHTTLDLAKRLSGSSGANKLHKALLKHNPISLQYVCRHHKCKRLVDLKVEESDEEGKFEFILGNYNAATGVFTRSHFKTDEAVWTGREVVLTGSTPNGLVTIRLRYHSHHYLSGNVNYSKKHDPTLKKEFAIHVHLTDDTSNLCVDEFEDTESINEDSHKVSVDSLDSRKPIPSGERETNLTRTYSK